VSSAQSPISYLFLAPSGKLYQRYKMCSLTTKHMTAVLLLFLANDAQGQNTPNLVFPLNTGQSLSEYFLNVLVSMKLVQSHIWPLIIKEKANQSRHAFSLGMSQVARQDLSMTAQGPSLCSFQPHMICRWISSVSSPVKTCPSRRM
jgi:hypothetical protein